MGTLLLKKLSTGLAFALTIALGSSTSAVHGSTRFSYTVTELGTLPNYTDSHVKGINDLGQAVGYSGNRSTDQAFLWENGKMTGLGTLGGNNSMAYGINNKGQVVGQSQTSSGPYHAFLWENGKMTDLGSLGSNSNSSVAYGINNKGQVVGYSVTQQNYIHCVLWSGGTIQDITPRLKDGGGFGSACFATSINDKSALVGYLLLKGKDTSPFVSRNGARIFLDKRVLGVNSGLYFLSVEGINNNGQIVGNRWNSKAYLLTPTWVTP